MEEQKYFTPEIEDIYVGYECEQLISTIGEYDTEPHNMWIKEVFGKGSWLPQGDVGGLIHWYHTCILAKRLRTPYLTKEQIETEGWKFCYELKSTFESSLTGKITSTAYLFLLRNYYSALYDGTTLIIFFDSEESRNPKDYITLDRKEFDTFYRGKCKSINEFRKLCKMLNTN